MTMGVSEVRGPLFSGMLIQRSIPRPSIYPVFDLKHPYINLGPKVSLFADTKRVLVLSSGFVEGSLNLGTLGQDFRSPRKTPMTPKLPGSMGR